MIARAPGKLVISGAYSVLEGSPAIVTAVDRYVIADSARVADWITPEVAAARLHSKPWFDASALRTEDRKIGLGSSAAILVASLAADELDTRPFESDQELAEAIADRARAAHAKVQPHGSGIDVVSSCFGGTLVAKRSGSTLEHASIRLPPDIYIEVWSAPHAQSTHDMLTRVRELQCRQPSLYASRIAEQAAASEQAVEALRIGESSLFLTALARQYRALDALGKDAGIAIVTDPLRELAETAAKESAAVLPAGAGGGDVAIFASFRPPSPALRASMMRLQHEQLHLSCGARGVHAAEKSAS